jgi:Transposase zinc-binding domain
MLAAPSRDWNVFKQIFADHWEPFQRAHPRYQTAYYDGLVAKMLACGNPEKMGSLEYRCLHCGQGKHLVAMSCKSSLCLRCAKVSVDNWVSQVSQVLHAGVIYRHIILTVPALFRTTFYHNAAVVLSAFMRCGHSAWMTSIAPSGASGSGGATSQCSTHMGAMGSITRTCICSLPAEAWMGRENAGSISSICPLRSCAVSGSGIC